MNQGPGWPPVFPGDSGPDPRPRGSNICPGRLRSGSEGPRFQPAVPGESGLCRWAHYVHQLSRETRDSEQGPVVAIRFPR